LSQHRGIGAHAVAPEGFGDDDDARAAWHVIVRGQRTAEEWRHAERDQRVERHEIRLYLLGLAVAEEVELIAPQSTDALGRARLFAQVVHVGAGLRAAERDELVGLWIGQRTE